MTLIGDRWRKERHSWAEAIAEHRLAEEGEAFLRGRLLILLRRRGWTGPVPPWLWLNEVAHGDRSALKLVAAYSQEVAAFKAIYTDQPGDVPWRRAQARVAAELLTRSEGSDETLTRLQTQALIELEDVIDDDATPAQLLTQALDRLQQVGPQPS
jgi:predicted aminopeptidase